jgi:Glyceraldehyde 3-phosphate dehydrogenase, NAD binding domain
MPCGRRPLAIMAPQSGAPPEFIQFDGRNVSVWGTLGADVGIKEGAFTVNGQAITVLAERDPATLPWRDLGVELVVESTGLFTDRDQAAKHLDAGAAGVIITAPAKNPDVTIVFERAGVRPESASHHLERLLHHQLSRPRGQNAPRHLRHPARVHDHRARLHQRSADARSAASGLTSGPGCDLGRAGAAAFARETRWPGHPCANAECLRRGLCGRRGARHLEGRGERGVPQSR